jgi:hypothetical protein
VDSDGIMEKSKAELEREEQEVQRRRELAALYAEAVGLLEAKKYQEALEKWNAIQAIDPRYKDGLGVKKTAGRKLDELTRPEAIGRRWPKITSDWFRLEANIPADREIFTEWLLLLSFAIILIIGLLYSAYLNLFHISQSGVVARCLSFSILGGLFGTVLAFALNKTIYNWHLKQSLAVIIGWFLSYGLTWIIWEYYFARSLTPIVTVFISLSAATATVAAIKWTRPATSPFSMIIIIVGWVLAWNAGNILGNHLAIFNTDYTSVFVDALVFLLGLLFTFGIQIERSWEVLKTALFGALGFAVGNYVLDIIDPLLPPFPAEIAFALWGLIGGAILEAPSRDSRRILSSAAIGGIGLLVGSYVAFDILPLITVEYANSTLSDKYFTLRQPFLGMGLGLAFGILIRRASAIGVLAVLGAGIYMITLALNVEILNISPSWENIVRGALVGLVLGYGYGYLGNAKPLESKSRVTKTKLVWVAIIGLLALAVPIVIWLSSPPPITSYRWDFDNSTEGWGYYNHLSVSQIRNGSLILKSTGLDPSFESPTPLVISASDTPVITVRMRIINGQGTIGQIFFLTDQDHRWGGDKVVAFLIEDDGVFHVYSILMSECPAWKDVIIKIRLDPVDNPAEANIQFVIDYISVHAR